MNDAKHIASLSLTHGQVLWVIDCMRIVEWLERPALDSVLKKFRRDGVPDFSSTGQQGCQGSNFSYNFEQLMDCVVAMKLVADGLAFRHVVGLMTSDPEKLRQYYRRAFFEAETGFGNVVEVKAEDGRKISIGGLYLDFHAVISKSGILSTTGPRLLDAWEALNRYMGGYSMLHPTGMVRLSQLALEAVRLAGHAPVIKRGRKG
jgi:hypothetical protein